MKKDNDKNSNSFGSKFKNWIKSKWKTILSVGGVMGSLCLYYLVKKDNIAEQCQKSVDGDKLSVNLQSNLLFLYVKNFASCNVSVGPTGSNEFALILKGQEKEIKCKEFSWPMALNYSRFNGSDYISPAVLVFKDKVRISQKKSESESETRSILALHKDFGINTPEFSLKISHCKEGSQAWLNCYGNDKTDNFKSTINLIIKNNSQKDLKIKYYYFYCGKSKSDTLKIAKSSTANKQFDRECYPQYIEYTDENDVTSRSAINYSTKKQEEKIGCCKVLENGNLEIECELPGEVGNELNSF